MAVAVFFLSRRFRVSSAQRIKIKKWDRSRSRPSPRFFGHTPSREVGKYRDSSSREAPPPGRKRSCAVRSSPFLPRISSKQFLNALGVARAGPGITRRMHARSAAEGGHHQSGIVRQLPAVRANMAIVQGFAGGIFRERGADSSNGGISAKAWKQIKFNRCGRRQDRGTRSVFRDSRKPRIISRGLRTLVE